MRRVTTAFRLILLRVLPQGSGLRRLIASSYHGFAEGRLEFRDQLSDRPIYRNSVGLRGYGAWRRQEDRRRRATAAAIPPEEFSLFSTSFAVIIEHAVGSQAGVARSRRSVELQTEAVASIHPVPDGAPLAELAAALTEDFVLVIKAGSVLAPTALAEVAKMHRIDPQLQVIVFDSDRRGFLGRRHSPLFRPAWSPETLLGYNYIGRAFAIRRQAVANVTATTASDTGIWRLLLEPWKESDLGRLSHVLLSEPSTARHVLGDGDAEMLRGVLAERGETARVDVVDGRVARVRFTPSEWPSVSIVIPTRHSRVNLDRLLPSLAATDYDRFDVLVMDNGGETAENVAWYRDNSHGLDLSVTWWTEQPFNYSRVNNVGVRATHGEVVVMLNDDTQVVDSGWLKEMVGHVVREGVGTVGAQLIQGDGFIQHGGVVLGPGGFADNLFAGMRPHSSSLLGDTDWYRNSLAVTGACVAVTREIFESVDGLDERFILCGSDVVLGLDQVIKGRRNVVIPFDIVRHFESLTRGTAVPAEDFYASYFRYHPWLQNGDPYASPNVSRLAAIPRFHNELDPRPVRLSLERVGRRFAKLSQSSSISEEAKGLMHKGSISSRDVEAVHALHTQTAGPLEIRTVNWFVPDIDMPFFGGLNTAFRIADKLAREHGVVNRFVMLAERNEAYVAGAIAAAFPGLAGSPIHFYDGDDAQIATIPPADIAIATLWLTAPHVAKSPGVKRKFYLMQDYEPGFYPASTMYAMAEESYRLGLYGICNTESMHAIYTGMYGGKATFFTPAVDRSIFHAEGRPEKSADDPVTIFAYARDHFRNCWELVYAALTEIKRRHGDKVRIVAAGARYLPPSSDFIDMGLLDYRATGALYRQADIGVTMQISRHPSYLPLELMASGVAMVAPDSEWFSWLFSPGENSLSTRRSFDDLVDNLDRLVRDADLRRTIALGGLNTIDAGHADWDAALDDVFSYMTDPDAVQRAE